MDLGGLTALRPCKKKALHWLMMHLRALQILKLEGISGDCSLLQEETEEPDKLVPPWAPEPQG